MKFFEWKENENEEDYNQRYITFINAIQNNGTFPGYFEISAAVIILNKKIIIYYNTFTGYNSLNEYNPSSAAKESIYIVYRNNLHFNLLK